MKLEIMKRTMLALAEMDLQAARKIMGIAESMAEMFPKKEEEEEVNRETLRPHSYEVQLPILNGYVSVKTIVMPTIVAQSLPSYKHSYAGATVN